VTQNLTNVLQWQTRTNVQFQYTVHISVYVKSGSLRTGRLTHPSSHCMVLAAAFSYIVSRKNCVIRVFQKLIPTLFWKKTERKTSDARGHYTQCLKKVAHHTLRNIFV